MKPANKSPDPSTGVIPRDEFYALISAPFGEACKKIRRYDPLWGRAVGEKIDWRVEVSGMRYGVAYVKAASEKEAKKLAENLDGDKIDWGDDGDDIVIDLIEPEEK